LAQYGAADMRREYNTEKACAPHCTVSCVHYVFYFDSWRKPQTQPDTRPLDSTSKDALIHIGSASR
jgi:hypothetical protein